MQGRFVDATAEELAAVDALCIICRDEMEVGKKLPCGHILHQHCLRSWLERQQVCPLCRRSVFAEENAPNANQANHPQANVPLEGLAAAAAGGAPVVVNNPQQVAQLLRALNQLHPQQHQHQQQHAPAHAAPAVDQAELLDRVRNLEEQLSDVQHDLKTVLALLQQAPPRAGPTFPVTPVLNTPATPKTPSTPLPAQRPPSPELSPIPLESSADLERSRERDDLRNKRLLRFSGVLENSQEEKQSETE